jgi:hypothetical protein
MAALVGANASGRIGLRGIVASLKDQRSLDGSCMFARMKDHNFSFLELELGHHKRDTQKRRGKLCWIGSRDLGWLAG